MWSVNFLAHMVFCMQASSVFVSFDQSTFFCLCHVPYSARGKIKFLLIAFFQQQLSSSHCSTKAIFDEFLATHCPVDRFSQQCSGFLQQQPLNNALHAWSFWNVQSMGYVLTFLCLLIFSKKNL